MATFTYAGRDQDGRPVSGEIEAESQAAASRRLLERGIVGMDIRRKSEPRSSAPSAFVPLWGCGPADFMVFFRQLAGMLRGGMTLSQALTSLATSAPTERLRQIAKAAAERVSTGAKLSEVMKEYPRVFDSFQIAMVETGETSGNLDAILSRLAEYLEHEIELRNLLRRITFHPKLVFVFAIIVVLALRRTEFGASLGPLAAAIPWMIGILAVVWLLFTLGLCDPTFRSAWDSLKLVLPVLGGVVRGLAAAKFSSGLAALYRSGAPLSSAVRTAAAASGNSHVEKRLLAAASLLDQGHSLSDVVARAGVFPPVMLSMLATGEQTGSVDDALEKVREYLDGESRTKAEQIGWALAIGMYLAVALLVGYIAVSFYSTVSGTYDLHM